MHLLFASAVFSSRAEMTWIYTVQLSADVQTSSARITLNWPQDPNGANSYTIYRKNVSDTSWGSGTILSGTSTSYVDNNVAVGGVYEYQIIKAATLGYTGYGYISAGINAPLLESRGKVVLVVDNTFTSSLGSELARLQSDLIGDGWTVLRHDVARSATPESVRSVIQADYYADPQNVKAVFLFGHVPILRCGNLNVDGHQARPMPADAFYGDMDGTWNNPDYLPSDVELMVGRVDLANMPGTYAYSPWPSELELLRNYLNKDHNWRHKLVAVPRRALIGNRFGDRNGEAFAASGFRNFEPFVGPGNTDLANEQDSAPVNQRWSSMLAAGTYLWAYGCGGGSYTSMSGLGTNGLYYDITSYDVVGQDAKAVFFMMFGSWLGEWDRTDDLMRATLATPSLGLTCSWAGRPHWFYHHMGLGEVIGYSARLTMNNSSLYQNQINQFTRGVHIAFMGDPTLRLHPVAPPVGLTAVSNSSGVSLSWPASTDSVLGYHVYRANIPAGPFQRMTSSITSGTSFTDSSPSAGTFIYMVRAVKLESTPSGSYYNPSQGVFATVDSSGNGSSGDTAPPILSITSPANNATVSNTLQVVATATDNIGVAGVQFRLDATNLCPEQTAAPYQYAWNTLLASNGQHRLLAVARDAAGNWATSAVVTVVVSNSTNSGGTNTNTVPGVDFVWVDDALPAGAQPGASGGDSWNWVNSNPNPHSGSLAQLSTGSGLHEHYFNFAWDTMNIGTGEVLFAYVYLDPANPPAEIMLHWCDGSWEHRAYWGANLFNYGIDGTPGRYYAGPLPATGKWVRLEVPARAVNLEGSSVKGMDFSFYGGQGAWDTIGKGRVAVAATVTAGQSGVTLSWPSVPGNIYQVFSQDVFGGTNWIPLSPSITATNTITSWSDMTARNCVLRFYRIYSH